MTEAKTPKDTQSSSEYVEFLLEMLEPMGALSSGKMFGGYVIRHAAIPFALIFNDEIYFKVDAYNKADYEMAGSEPFRYTKGNKEIEISNWKLPEELLDDPETLIEWAFKSYEAGLRAKAAKRPTAKKRG